MTFYRKNLNKVNQDLINITILTLVCLGIIAIIWIVKSDGIWGSEVDWISQHFAIPEYFRTRFYDTGEIFPNFAFQLGAGQNIYNFAYYGLMNPMYLPAYLMPFVTMADYIQVVSILSVLISCIICYFLLKRHFSRGISLFLAIIFMCSAPLIFHSHRHIMFINYIPFQLLSMMTVGEKDTPKNRVKLIIYSYCILCTSFYFGIGAFASILIYALYLQLKKFPRLKIKYHLRLIISKVLCMLLGGITSGVLLVPTFFTLLRGRENSASKINILELLVPSVNLQYLLYDRYSMGLTVIGLISIITMLKFGDKAEKFLAYMFSIVICFPIITYVLNGTMYLDAKVYIPLIPLLLVLLGEFIVKLFLYKLNFKKTGIILAVLIIISIVFSSEALYKSLILIADAIITFSAIMIFIKTKRKQVFIVTVITLSIINCLSVNMTEKFVSKEKVEELYSDDIQELVDKTVAMDNSFYRFAGDSEFGEAVNRIYSKDYYTTNNYSSVNNSEYRKFRFNDSASENCHRNNALQTQPDNVIFNVLMGCRYRISNNFSLMPGEDIEYRSGDLNILKNENSLPIGYASANTMNEEYWKQLNPAAKLEAMLENIIVPFDSSNPVIPSKDSVLTKNYILSGETERITKLKESYEIKSDVPFSINAKFDEILDDKLVIFQFNADNRIGKMTKSSDIWVSVNDIKNTLSDPDWKYNNKNYNFSYVISSKESIRELSFEFSSGNYILSDFELYTLDESVLKSASSNKDEFVIDRETVGGDNIQGAINVTSDGWFNLSVPYDEGFEILVDGIKTNYYKTNTAFIGFPISRGEHYISINYSTPYKTIGILMSIAGLGMSICMIVYMSGRKKIRRRLAVPTGGSYL